MSSTGFVCVRRFRAGVVAAALCAVVSLLAQGCGADAGSACEEAREEMQRHISTVCREPAYATANFCTVCVTAGYFSKTGGASDCKCADLVFDVEFCAYERGTNARAKVRSAVAQAIDDCPDPRIGQSDAGVLDSGSAGASGAAGAGGS